MIREVHEISREAAVNLYYTLRHPSAEYVAQVKEMMERLQENMTVEHEDGQDVVEFSDLDLSFLDADRIGYVKTNHPVIHCFSFSGDASLGYKTNENEYRLFAPNVA